MKAELITIGNEILLGDTLNTNAQWLGLELSSRGIPVQFAQTIGDRHQDILEALQLAATRSDVILTTGGLGPTHDDITKKAVADFLNEPYRLDETVLTYIKKVFEKRGIPFSSSNEAQAMVPVSAHILFNSRGTAPGMWFELGNGRILIVLPGVPYEMKGILEDEGFMKLSERFPAADVIQHRYIQTAGIGESTLSDMKLASLNTLWDDTLSLAYLPNEEGLTLRLTAVTTTKEEGERRLNEVSDRIYAQAKEFIVGEGKGRSMAPIIADLLRERNQTVSLAESCTGGMVMSALTDASGASKFLIGGIVAYDNRIKQEQLGVPMEVLQQFGAVSKETALAMAEGVRTRFKTTYGLAVTGIAGPDDGSDEKPVGTIWYGVSTPIQTYAFKLQLTKIRNVNRRRTVTVILDALRRELLSIPSLPYSATKVS